MEQQKLQVHSHIIFSNILASSRQSSLLRLTESAIRPQSLPPTRLSIPIPAHNRHFASLSTQHQSTLSTPIPTNKKETRTWLLENCHSAKQITVHLTSIPFN